MGGRVALAVLIEAFSPRDNPVQRRQHVVDHGRVGVFIYRNASRGVRNVDRDGAIGDTGADNYICDPAGYVEHLISAGRSYVKCVCVHTDMDTARHGPLQGPRGAIAYIRPLIRHFVDDVLWTPRI